DKKDKRMVRIFLTELGIEKRNLSREKVIQFNTHLRNNIKEKDLEVFFKVMGGINELIDENDIFN
ncbi:MAG: MarR family transcriptional regulator, partial [Flavobacteriales bacterium]